MALNVKPLGDRVLVEPAEEKEVKKGDAVLMVGDEGAMPHEGEQGEPVDVLAMGRVAQEGEGFCRGCGGAKAAGGGHQCFGGRFCGKCGGVWTMNHAMMCRGRQNVVMVAGRASLNVGNGASAGRGGVSGMGGQRAGFGGPFRGGQRGGRH